MKKKLPLCIKIILDELDKEKKELVDYLQEVEEKLNQYDEDHYLN